MTYFVSMDLLVQEKTTVLCELIYQLIQRNYKILVTGPSNVSVDNILRKCVEDLNIKNVVRIGIKSKVKKKNYIIIVMMRRLKNVIVINYVKILIMKLKN